MWMCLCEELYVNKDNQATKSETCSCKILVSSRSTSHHSEIQEYFLHLLSHQRHERDVTALKMEICIQTAHPPTSSNQTTRKNWPFVWRKERTLESSDNRGHQSNANTHYWRPQRRRTYSICALRVEWDWHRTLSHKHERFTILWSSASSTSVASRSQWWKTSERRKTSLTWSICPIIRLRASKIYPSSLVFTRFF